MPENYDTELKVPQLRDFGVKPKEYILCSGGGADEDLETISKPSQGDASPFRKRGIEGDFSPCR